MSRFAYQLQEFDAPKAGLVVLQSDEVIEREMRQMMPQSIQLMFTRIPSGLEVTAQSLNAMKSDLPEAVARFPQGLQFDVIGYGCTSATAQIGAEGVAGQIRSSAQTRAVTQPVSALVAACRSMNISRLAFLSPYIESVSEPLRSVLASEGVDTPIFGSFEEAEEFRVARISPDSIAAAARSLAADSDVDGVFLSCTNLACLSVLEQLETELEVPVLSSNLVLGWHMAQLAGGAAITAPGKLAKTPLA